MGLVLPTHKYTPPTAIRKHKDWRGTRFSYFFRWPPLGNSRARVSRNISYFGSPEWPRKTAGKLLENGSKKVSKQMVKKTVQKSWKTQLLRTPLKQGPLKPCPFERSRDELSGGGIKTSVRPNLVIVFSFWSFDFYANLRPSEKHGLDGLEITGRIKGKSQLVVFI